MAKKPKRRYRLSRVPLKAAKSAFGLASHPYKVDLVGRHDELIPVEIPLDQKLCTKHEVNLATVRVFQWDESTKRSTIVDSSGIDDRWENAVARIHEPGIYLAAGASSNPWVGHAVATLRQFRPLLIDPQIGPRIAGRLCPAILCPNMLGEVFQDIGEPADFGLPSLPPRDLCEICLGGDLGHTIDLYPEPRIPLRPGNCCGTCNLNSYLDCNPRIRRAIVWRDPGPRRYDEWTREQKRNLAAAFDTIRASGVVGLPQPVPATARRPGDPPALLSEADAWQAYYIHLAHTLVVDSCGWVNWSLRTYASEDLELLLDSDGMFMAVTGGYEMRGIPHGIASHGDPSRVYNWLRENALIANDPLRTVGRVLEWCRDNLTHYFGRRTPENMEAHWQYAGYPPVERMIAGTPGPPSHGTRHWTAGCWGTAGFLRLVLRTINIPSTLVMNCGHAQPYLPTLGRYLSHGDDPYTSQTRNGAFAGTDLLIDEATFDAWFGDEVPDRCDNIGRRPRQLAGESP